MSKQKLSKLNTWINDDSDENIRSIPGRPENKTVRVKSTITLPEEVERLIRLNYAETKEKKSHLLERLVLENLGKKYSKK